MLFLLVRYFLCYGRGKDKYIRDRFMDTAQDIQSTAPAPASLQEALDQLKEIYKEYAAGMNELERKQDEILEKFQRAIDQAKEEAIEDKLGLPHHPNEQ